MAQLRILSDALVVLIGPSSSGKSTWAARHFRPEQVVSSDHLRAVVGESRDDQRAGTDAFAVLDEIVTRRIGRRLLTVVDTLGLDGKRRAAWLGLARKRRMPCVAVVFDVAADVLRARNRSRRRPLPASVLNSQIRSLVGAREALDSERFTAVLSASEDDVVRVVPRVFLDAPTARSRQQEDPMTMQFGLQIPRFDGYHPRGTPPSTPGASQHRERLAAIARAAEDAGIASLWVMDHFLQIPFQGREWDDMLESYTTLAYLAGVTERIRLGVLVTGVTYRNLAHLGKIVATLDVLSGGRANCGLGAAWFEREHQVYGWDFPPLAERYARLEDALQLLPLLWGPGSPRFEGRTITVPEAICYPRPLQDKVPILVGGSGERRTLRLVAQYADACNLFGDVTTVRRKVEVLRRHCAEVGRDPAEVEVTTLGTVLVGADPDDLARRLDAGRPADQSPETFAARVSAGTVDDQIGRFREFAEAGVGTAIVTLPGVDPEAVALLGHVVRAFA